MSTIPQKRSSVTGSGPKIAVRDAVGWGRVVIVSTVAVLCTGFSGALYLGQFMTKVEFQRFIEQHNRYVETQEQVSTQLQQSIGTQKHLVDSVNKLSDTVTALNREVGELQGAIKSTRGRP